MVKKTVETCTKHYFEDGVSVENHIEYYYDTEKEKLEHIEVMKEKGFVESGSVCKNIGTLTEPRYVYVGVYSRVANYSPDSI